MKILNESWDRDGVSYTLLTEGDDGVQRGPETFTRRTLKLVYDDGIQVREESGALMVQAEPKGTLRADAISRHRMAHATRIRAAAELLAAREQHP